MTTITFDEELNLEKLHFKDLAEFQDYLLLHQHSPGPSEFYKNLIDKRLEEFENRTEKGSSWEDLKARIVSRG